MCPYPEYDLEFYTELEPAPGFLESFVLWLWSFIPTPRTFAINRSINEIS